jgi:hypothetical protein
MLDPPKAFGRCRIGVSQAITSNRSLTKPIQFEASLAPEEEDFQRISEEKEAAQSEKERYKKELEDRDEYCCVCRSGGSTRGCFQQASKGSPHLWFWW